MSKVSLFRSHSRVEYIDDTPSSTRQEFKEEADVNALMARYQKSGVFPAPSGQMEYVNFDVPDFHDAMNMLIEAERAFMTLPARVRERFGNNAYDFVEFAQDKANLSQLREWGLAAPEVAAERPSTPPESNAPSALSAAPAASGGSAQ